MLTHLTVWKHFVDLIFQNPFSETLKEFFEANFGEVTECNIMKDQMTKKSR